MATPRRRGQRGSEQVQTWHIRQKLTDFHSVEGFDDCLRFRVGVPRGTLVMLRAGKTNFPSPLRQLRTGLDAGCCQCFKAMMGKRSGTCVRSAAMPLNCVVNSSTDPSVSLGDVAMVIVGKNGRPISSVDE